MANEAKPLQDHGGDRTGEQVDSINLKSSDTSDYRVARIARDHPDILERMKANEFGSVNAAAVEAGTQQPKKQV